MNKAKPKARSNTKKRQKLHTREDCLTIAQRICKYREILEYGRLWCISCDCELELGSSNAQGGHYISRQDRATETEADNIWPQCGRCNVLQRGNIPAYRYNLVRLIGSERVERLEYMSMARKGSEEAALHLSQEDYAKAMEIKKPKYYEELYQELKVKEKEYKNALQI